MIAILAALIPIFLIIVLGQVFQRTRMVPQAFWVSAERMTFYVFFPSLLVVGTAKVDLGGLEVAPMLGALVCGILLVVALVFALRPLLAADGPVLTSLVQGAIRPNVYLGIAAAAALYGGEGLALVSLCVAVAVPLVNLISVIVLVRYGATGGSPRGWRSMVLPVASNPLIVACVIGLCLNVAGFKSIPVLTPLLEILGHAALPVGLLAVGAGLDFEAVRRTGTSLTVTCLLKLVALPMVTFGLTAAFGVDATAAAVAVLYATLPGSASAYVMARQMGGDAPLLAAVITATTLAAAVTMPIAVMVAT